MAIHDVPTTAPLSVLEYTAPDGTTLRYGKLVNREQPETGRSLLFIPGLGGSVKGALGFLSLLLPVFSPIVAPDLRGFGLNPIETPLRSAQYHLPDLEAFQNALGLTDLPDLTLVGISLGGVLATHLAVAHPKRYKRLALIAPAYAAHPTMFPLAYQLNNISRRIVQGTRAVTHLPYGVEALTRNPVILNDPQYKDAPKTDLTIDYLLSVKNLNHAALGKTKDIALPTLMVVPGRDLVCDPKAMRQGYARIPENTPKIIKEYPELYHDVLFEAEYPQIARDILGWAVNT